MRTTLSRPKLLLLARGSEPLPPHLGQDLELLGLDAHVYDLGAPAHADGLLPAHVRASVGETRPLHLCVRERVQLVSADGLGWRRGKQGEPREDRQRSGGRLLEAVRCCGHLQRGGGSGARGGSTRHSGSVEGASGSEGVSGGAERRDCDGDHGELHDGKGG